MLLPRSICLAWQREGKDMASFREKDEDVWRLQVVVDDPKRMKLIQSQCAWIWSRDDEIGRFRDRQAVRDGGITQFCLVTTEGWMCPTDAQDPIYLLFDIFSLGCVWGFIVLNGLHPFGSDPISRIANRQPMWLTLSQMEAFGLFKPDFSLSVFQLIVRMLNF